MIPFGRAWLALCLLLSPACAAAQAPAPNPSLTAMANGVRDDAHARALTLRRYDIAVELRGAIAETTIEASFANASNEQLEGDFRLALPPGAVVTGYALDVNGRMIDGVLVDRPRAKAVYEARIRRGVDPGLAETSPDGIFETRIFPIVPGRGRTIRVRFVAPVPLDGYRLPIAIEAPAESWSIAAHATGAIEAPAIALPGGAHLALERVADGYAGKSTGKSEPLSGALLVARAAAPDVLVSAHRNGEYDLQLGGALPAMAAARPAPQRLRIYWDRSRSRLGSDIAAEIALVRAYIERVHPATIELVGFNSSGAERQTVESADAAAAWLKTLRYRGATSFANLTDDIAADRCLLFSDGKPSIERKAPFAPSCRLDAVSSAPDADRGWLQHLTANHGGRALALDAHNANAILDVLAGNAPNVLAVLDRDGKHLPFIPLDAPAGRWLVLARAPEGGPVTIRIGWAGAHQDVVLAADGTPASFDGAGALLAADQLASLGATEQRADYVALSRRYGIASPSLSFIVLELPTDYITAGIEPPAGYPAEGRDTYLRQRKQQEAEQAKDRRARIDQIAKQWAEQVAWWKTKFDPNARPKRIQTSRAFDRPGLPPPPPAPIVAPPPIVMAPSAPPPRQAPVAGVMANEAQDIVVTGVRSSDVGRFPGRRAREDDGEAPSIQIDAWQPDRPYLELYDGKPADFDERFLEAERRHGSLPIFYLDTAEWLRKHGRTADAIEMVLSALELPTANEVTLGIVADRLERYGQIDRAIELRERQVVLDPDQPQPRRLLALALARRAALVPAHARADLARAIGLLYDIAISPQEGAWDGIELIALDEANAMVPRLRRAGGTPAMDPRLIALLDVDLRVVIDWTTDATDMDLWVDEPDKERAIYNNPNTAIGGRLSNDMTEGYGPEEYMLHRAPAGTYLVQANVYAPDRLDPNGATILTAHLFRDYGRPTQREESIDVELKRDEKGAKIIGRIVVPGGQSAPRKK